VDTFVYAACFEDEDGNCVRFGAPKPGLTPSPVVFVTDRSNAVIVFPY